MLRVGYFDDYNKKSILLISKQTAEIIMIVFLVKKIKSRISKYINHSNKLNGWWASVYLNIIEIPHNFKI